MNSGPRNDDSWPELASSLPNPPHATRDESSGDFRGMYEQSAYSISPDESGRTADADHPASWPAIPGYEIDALIGRGGMGMVFRAKQRGLDRTVALKMILDTGFATPTQKLRLQIEAENAACVRHPNIVQVYDVGEHDGQPFFALEYVQGGSLADWLKRHRPTLRTAAQLVETLARAIHAAHLHGIVHRDLKPDNVLLEGSDGELVPKIADFGLAKRLDRVSGLTGSGAVMGTPHYMAPEQAQGKNKLIGPAADQFALGVIFYQLLTGKLPLAADTLPELLLKIMAAEPVAPRRLNPSVPVDLESICLKCLEKDPAHRYPSAEALAEDLKNWREHRPITARPATRLERVGKWCRRYPAPTALIAVSILAALISAGLAWWALDAERAARAAHDARELALYQVQTERDAKDQQFLAAQKAQQQAEEREQETKAVLHFVEEHILAAARPKDQSGGLGSDVKLRDAIEAALPFLDSSFKEQPLTEARLRVTIGSSFYYLGAADLAEPMFARARNLFAAHLGADHPLTLAAMSNLAISYSYLGRRAEALKLREATLAKRKEILGAEHLDTLQSMSDLANSYEAAGRYWAAMPLREDVLRRRSAILGPSHPDTLDSMQNLANSYESLGRLRDAHQLYVQALAGYQALFGPEHPLTLRTTHNLANVLADLGQHTEALLLREDTLAKRRKRLGADHPDTINSMRNLVLSYYLAGRLQEALVLCEETLRQSKAKLGPITPTPL